MTAIISYSFHKLCLACVCLITGECRGAGKDTIHLEVHVPRIRSAHSPQQHLPLHGRPPGLCRTTLHFWNRRELEPGEQD